MKALFASLAIAAGLVAGAIPADAGQTCFWVGSTLFCTSSSGQTQTCQMVGQFMFCN